MRNKDYGLLVLEALKKNNVIDDELYEKCSKPSYIQDLPGDLRTTDLDLLEERADVLDKRIEKTNKEITDIQKEINKLDKNITMEHNYLKNEMKNRGWDKRASDDYVDDLSADLQKQYKRITDAMDSFNEKVEAHFNDEKDMTSFAENLANDYYDFEKKLLNYYGKSDWRIGPTHPLAHWTSFYSEKNQFDGILNAISHSNQLMSDKKPLNIELNKKQSILNDYEDAYEKTSVKIDSIILS